MVTVMVLLILAPLGFASTTDQDVRAVESQLTVYRPFLSQTWQTFFSVGAPRIYVTPKLVPYQNAVTTACGRMAPGNAYFCAKDNTIYYDQQFLASEMRAVGAAVHSDGNYVPVAILAHEWGHAADYWYRRQDTTWLWGDATTELRADCLAGAVTLAAGKAGRLSATSVKEAEMSLQRSGEIDYSKYLPEDPRRPKSEMEKLKESLGKMAAHGDPAKRVQAFRNGYSGGVRACLTGPK